MQLSVIIPAYNSAKTIENALVSVFNQSAFAVESKARLEVIVVDDASSDGTVATVQGLLDGPTYKSSFMTLKLLEQPSNAGPASARNRGIKEAKGEWIAFLDADDEWLPEKLAIQMRMIEKHPEMDFWCGEVRTVAEDGGREEKDEGGNLKPEKERRRETGDGGRRTEDGEEKDEGGNLKPEKERREKTDVGGQMSEVGCRKSEISKHLYRTEDGEEKDEGGNLKPEKERREKTEDLLSLDDFVIANPVATSTVLVRKSVLEEVGGFDERFRGPEDYDLWMRIAGRRDLVTNVVATTGAAVPVEGGDESGVYRMAKIEAPLARYRSEAGSLSMDDRKFLPQVLRVLDKAFGDGGVLYTSRHLKPLALANQYWNASWMAFTRHARIEAIRLLLKGWCLSKKIISHRAHREIKKPARIGEEFFDSCNQQHVDNIRKREWGRLLLRYLIGRKSDAKLLKSL